MSTTPNLQVAKKAWLEAHQNMIGASRAPACLGLDRFTSPYTEHCYMTGDLERPSLEDNEAARWGQLLEPAIRDECSVRLGQRIHHHGPYHLSTSPQVPHMCCTPDGRIGLVTRNTDALFQQHNMDPPRDAPGTLQIKTSSAYLERDWKDDWPIGYQVQCQHELVVTGARWGVLAVLIGGQKLRLFPFHQHAMFCGGLVKTLKDFMGGVERREPPPGRRTRVYDRYLEESL